jgi:DNA-binding Lrp family transcriptional regulator
MVDETEKTQEPDSTKRMSDAEFATIRELYELGKAGIAELSDQFGFSRQTLSKRLKEAGAVKGSRAHELAAVAKAAAVATTERFAEKRAEMIEDTRMSGIPALKQARMLAQKVVLDQVKRSSSGGGKIDLAAIDDDLRAIGRYNKILVDNINATLGILKADEHTDDADLPTLTIEDLTDDDILRHHIGTGALPEDATVEDLNLHEVEI